MRLNWTRRDTVFLLLSGLAVLAYALAAGGGFPLDDSWIHQTFARNLAQRGEWAFLPGQPSAASTSPLYTLLLSVGYGLRVPFLWWTHGLGALTLAFMAMLGARLAEKALPEQKRIGWWAGLALIMTWHLIWAGASGMETALFGMLTLLLLWLAWREVDAPAHGLLRRGALFGLCTALATLTRPEGVLLGGIVALWLLLARPQGRLWRVLLWGTAAALAFALALLPYLLLNWQLTGGLLPNTAAAKFEQHAILLTLPYPQRVAMLALAIFAGGQFALLPGMLAYVVQMTREQRFVALLPLFWALALIALYAARLPAAYQHGRYVIPALPALVLLGVVGTAQLLRHSRRSALWRLATRVLAISAVLLYGIFAVWGVSIYQTDVAIINGEMVQAAQWIDENLPDDALLAIHDVGAVGYFAPRPLLDIAGLISPEVIPIVADDEALWQWMEANDADYLMAFPDQIPGDDPDDPRLCPVFRTDTAITRRQGGANMTIYRLAWDMNCSE